MTSRPGSLLLSRAPVTSTSDKPSAVGGAGPQRSVMSWIPPGSAAATAAAAAAASAAAAKNTAVQGNTAVPRLAFSAGTGAANSGMNGSGAAPVRYASPHANLSSVPSAPAVGKGGGFRWQPTGEPSAAVATPRPSQPSAVVVNAVGDEASLRATSASKGVMQPSCVRSATDEKKLMRELPDRSSGSVASSTTSSTVAGSSSVTVSATASVALPPAAPQQASGTFPVGTAASRSMAVPMAAPPNGTAPAAASTAVPAMRVMTGGASGRGASMTPREGPGRRRASSPPPLPHAPSLEPPQLVPPAVPQSSSPNAALPVGMSQVPIAQASHRARCMVVEPQQPSDGASNAQGPGTGSAQRWVSPARGIESVPTAAPAITPAPMPPTVSAVTSPSTEPPGWTKPPGGWFHAHAAVATNHSPRQRKPLE